MVAQNPKKRNHEILSERQLGVRHGLQLRSWVWYTCGRSSLTQQ